MRQSARLSALTAARSACMSVTSPIRSCAPTPGVANIAAAKTRGAMYLLICFSLIFRCSRFRAVHFDQASILARLPRLDAQCGSPARSAGPRAYTRSQHPTIAKPIQRAFLAYFCAAERRSRRRQSSAQCDVNLPEPRGLLQWYGFDRGRMTDLTRTGDAVGNAGKGLDGVAARTREVARGLAGQAREGGAR